MLLLFALIILSNSKQQCSCRYGGGAQFACGSIIWIPSNYYICCNNVWFVCASGYPSNKCGHCGRFNNINTLLLDDSYHFTKSGNLITTKVTKVISNVESTFDVDKKILSEELKINDLILWPIFDLQLDIGDTQVTDNIVMKIEHYNVTHLHNKCCVSTSDKFPSRQVKFCCGDVCS